MSAPFPRSWLVLALLGSLMFLACPRLGASDALTALTARISQGHPTRIVCLGDSITGAYYHTGGQRSWCDMLGLALQRAYPRANLEWINAGVSGESTVDGLRRLQRDVLETDPQLVVVLFGMNDVTRISSREFRNHLQSIAQQCVDHGSAVLLCTPNSVIDNSARPNERLAEFASATITLAEDMGLPAVDLFQHWQQWRQRDPDGWMLAMSDEIHPNMNGHQRIAQRIAETITGRQVRVDDLRPPLQGLSHTFDRLRDGKPVRLVAMPPYDRLVPPLLRRHFPDAQIEVVPWPVAAKSVEQLAAWGERIRGLSPDLVVPTVPLAVVPEDRTTLIREGQWILNWSFPFAGRAWDVVPITPAVHGGLDSATSADVAIVRRMMVGKDVRPVDRAVENDRSAAETLSSWIDDQLRVWRGARSVLPPLNDFVYVPVQPWPFRPEPRTVKTRIYYPGGSLSNLNEQTGIMLSLHNWGGRDCAGTADPQILADRYNVVALCVNYLQSGPPAPGVQAPYDFGYLQSLDALRALGTVYRGLKLANLAFDSRRIFCTGGSGGGNVTLMANKLAPRTFACVIDLCGMNRLSDDMAFNEPGGSPLQAGWSRDPADDNYLSADQQQIRFVAHPDHLQTMKRLGGGARIVVVHGTADATCPFADAAQMVQHMQTAGLDVEACFIDEADVDGKVFTTSGHALGNRTEIVDRVSGKYLSPESPERVVRRGATDFDLGGEVTYNTSNGRFVISYRQGLPRGRFEPAAP